MTYTGNVGKCPATCQATIMVPPWRGPSTPWPWCQRIPEQCFPQTLDWEGWSRTVATTFSRSHSYGFLYLGEMKCLVYEAPIYTPEDARVAEAAAIIRETESFSCRYQLCINLNGRLWIQSNHPASNLSRTPSEETENLPDVCHIKGFRFISSTNPQSLYTEFFTLCIYGIYSFYIDLSKKLNIGQVQKGCISMHFSEYRHIKMI